MKHTLKVLLLIGLLAFPQLTRADAIVQPVATATTAGASGLMTGVSAVANGTWLVVKGVSGILWLATKGVYYGTSAIAHGVGHLVHHSPKQGVPPP